MKDIIQYIDRSTYVILYRLYCDSPAAILPEEICGKPVAELADHAFSDQPSLLYQTWEIKTAFFRDGLWLAQGGPGEGRSAVRPPELCGRSLKSVRLPDSLKGVGNYAFYGCDRLEEISFPEGLCRIGSGLFNSCPSIRRLIFRQGTAAPLSDAPAPPETCAASSGQNAPGGPMTPPLLQEVLMTISHEVEAVVLGPSGREQYRLLFPEYYEEPRENTPGRIIQTIWHGTGYQYRQCFLDRRLEFSGYDRLLPAARAQESPLTVVKIALYRLKSQAGLTEESRELYTDCLRRLSPQALDFMMTDRETDLTVWLRLLEDTGFYTSDLIDMMIDFFTKAGQGDASAYLMDLRRRKFAPVRRQKYEF